MGCRGGAAARARGGGPKAQPLPVRSHSQLSGALKRPCCSSEDLPLIDSSKRIDHRMMSNAESASPDFFLIASSCSLVFCGAAAFSPISESTSSKPTQV